MYLSLAFIRFLESAPAAFAVGLILLPRLIGEDPERFKKPIAVLALFRAIIGFALFYFICRQIIPADRPLTFELILQLMRDTAVGWAWVATQFLAFIFAGLTISRLFKSAKILESITLWTGIALLSVVSVTGHAIDDGLSKWTQISFFLHTAAGLTWLGGLLGLIWWMLTAHSKSPELAAELAEKWSRIAKIAMLVVAASGFIIALENVGSVPNMLATPYGRLLTLKLTFLVGALLCALMIVRYMSRRPAGEFNVAWVGNVGAIEAVFGLGLLAIASYIAVITPASHENDIYWPLPFRLSYIATWGQKPIFPSPTWYWAIAGVALALGAVMVWFTPATREKRLYATPAATIAALLCIATSFSTEAFTDTYNDPTQDFTAESVARGIESFQANCTGCHGPMGEGNGPLSKELKDAKGVLVSPADLTAPHVGTHTIGDIFHWLTNGSANAVMPSFAQVLDTDDRWDVINYLLVLSSTNRSRFIGPGGMIQWLIAPDFALIDPKEEITSFFKLRGKPTLLSFARCETSGDAGKSLSESLVMAAETAKAAGVNHVTVFTGACPEAAKGREPLHPRSVERAYSVMNRYPNEPYTDQIDETHFLIDRSGYIRARFRHFAPDNGNHTQLTTQAMIMTQEPVVEINLHSH